MPKLVSPPLSSLLPGLAFHAQSGPSKPITRFHHSQNFGSMLGAAGALRLLPTGGGAVP